MDIFKSAAIHRDDFRRELKEVDRAQREVMPGWRDLLARVIHGDEQLSTTERAQVLGVPNRRQFLRVGGVSIAGAALLAACGDDDDDDGSGSDTTQAPEDGGDADMDIVLANTATSLEALAVATYETAAGSGLVETPAVGDAAALFRDHHQEHFDALVATVEGAGATPFTEPNAVVKEQVVDPAVAAAQNEADIIDLAFTLESAAAQTYVFAATALSTPGLRSTIMAIGGVESRHALILATVGGKPVEERFPAAFFMSENPLPEGAVIS